MGDAIIDSILDYLKKHGLSKTASALESEVSSFHKDNKPLPIAADADDQDVFLVQKMHYENYAEQSAEMRNEKAEISGETFSHFEKPHSGYSSPSSHNSNLQHGIFTTSSLNQSNSSFDPASPPPIHAYDPSALDSPKTSPGKIEILAAVSDTESSPIHRPPLSRTSLPSPRSSLASPKTSESPRNHGTELLHPIPTQESISDDIHLKHGSNSESELPRLPPVRLRSVEKNLDMLRESETASTRHSLEGSHSGSAGKELPTPWSVDSAPDSATDPGTGIPGVVTLGPIVVGSSPGHVYGQDSLGSRKYRFSVSQGIVEAEEGSFDTAQENPFAPERFPADGSTDFPTEWDSDTYDDEDDVGYIRQSVEDEDWFLANEVNFPKEESGKVSKSTHSSGDQGVKGKEKGNAEVMPLPDDDVYFSGEEYYRGKESGGPESNSKGRTDGDEKDGNEIEEGEIADGKHTRHGSAWDELLSDITRQKEISEGREENRFERSKIGGAHDEEKINRTKERRREKEGDEVEEDEDEEDQINDGSLSIGMAGSDVAEVGSSLRDSLIGGSSDGDVDSMKGASFFSSSSLGRKFSNFSSENEDDWMKDQTISEHSFEKDPPGIVKTDSFDQRIYSNSFNYSNTSNNAREGTVLENNELDLFISNEKASKGNENATSDILSPQDLSGIQNEGKRTDDELEGRGVKDLEKEDFGFKVFDGFGSGSANREDNEKCNLSQNDGSNFLDQTNPIPSAGFSFPSPSSGGLSRKSSGKSMLSAGDPIPEKTVNDDVVQSVPSGTTCTADDTIVEWKRKSNASSPIISPRRSYNPDLDMFNNGFLRKGDIGDDMKGIQDESAFYELIDAKRERRGNLYGNWSESGNGIDLTDGTAALSQRQASESDRVGAELEKDRSINSDRIPSFNESINYPIGDYTKHQKENDKWGIRMQTVDTSVLEMTRDGTDKYKNSKEGEVEREEEEMFDIKEWKEEFEDDDEEDNEVEKDINEKKIKAYDGEKISEFSEADDGKTSTARGDEEDEEDVEDVEEGEEGIEEEDVNAQEQLQRLRAEENEYETFYLKVIHRKNRTGFEEEKDFPVVINSIIAGRYHVTEYLGSAAFSKAIQAHDLHMGIDVCMKIIKNNKDFFDQSLDEIKLLKYINKHDPADKHHILRLYDYFYHREHLFIVCELLRANLYEFHKYNRESGGEVYFTMPRLQSITRQCMEALQFIHSLGLIHCDLKPENILVKSYSKCEVKVIDFGSSCFQTDHLCSYVQSRSYRAPEVILGMPYDEKIDIWSLGCILAELSSGQVLFQNDSLASLLARVVGILGPIDTNFLSKGRDTHKYFTKNFKLYERNPETERLEILIPKKTSLKHRLPMGDSGFIEFVNYLLQVDPSKRPTASEALKHPWLSFPYDPINS